MAGPDGTDRHESQCDCPVSQEVKPLLLFRDRTVVDESRDSLLPSDRNICFKIREETTRGCSGRICILQDMNPTACLHSSDRGAGFAL